MKKMGALWHRVISSKCGVEEAGWWTHEVGGSYRGSVWKAIRMNWKIVGKEGGGTRGG